MKRPKFVKVVRQPEPRAGKDGRLRKEGDVLKVGTVVPVEWFEDTPDGVFAWLINPPEADGIGVLVEYAPEMKELARLRDMYPAAFPALTPDPSPSGRGEENADYPEQSPLNPPATQGEVTKRKSRSKEDGE